LDANNAFLNDILEKAIYMQISQGYKPTLIIM